MTFELHMYRKKTIRKQKATEIWQKIGTEILAIAHHKGNRVWRLNSIKLQDLHKYLRFSIETSKRVCLRNKDYVQGFNLRLRVKLNQTH